MNSKGFTLNELLVVIFIISLLSSVSFVYLRGGGEDFTLSRSAQKLSQDLRRAQEMAMSAKEHQGSTPLGYGIYFEINTNSAILFADFNGNKSFDSNEEVEILSLEKGVKISDLSGSPLTIVFSPPDPKVYISSGGDFGQITISLETKPAKQKTIKVNKAGLIYVE